MFLLCGGSVLHRLGQCSLEPVPALNEQLGTVTGGNKGTQGIWWQRKRNSEVQYKRYVVLYPGASGVRYAGCKGNQVLVVEVV